MKIARAALALAVLGALAGCASADDKAQEFGVWASALEHVASVDAAPKSGAVGPYSLSVHLVVDGAIDADSLTSLAETLNERAASQQLSDADINVIVGNAWAFSVDDDGADVATINKLRDDPLFVGATIWYQPLDHVAAYTGGIRATVGSQAALRDAPAALIAAYTGSGGDLDGVPVAVSTADGAFGILGESTAQPTSAIGLWQAVSGRVNPLAAQASLVSGAAEQLLLTVATAEDKATAESIGAQHPEVALAVEVQ